MSNGGQHLLPYWHSSADPAVVPRPATRANPPPDRREPRMLSSLIVSSVIASQTPPPDEKVAGFAFGAGRRQR